MSQHIAYQTHKALLKSAKTVAVAESCTGGLVSALLTRYSGSSLYFKAGIVAYSNAAKTKLLGVPSRIIARNGAVSEQTSKALAKNVKKFAKTDFGIGITGIAGPTGGTNAKPVGTVFIALSSKNDDYCEKFIFKGSRLVIRNKSALSALKMLKGFL